MPAEPVVMNVPLPEALAGVHNGGKTGTLVVRGDGVERQLILLEGELRAARSDREDEMLATWLVSRGLITEEQKALLLFRLGQNEPSALGHILLRVGFVDRDTLGRELQALAMHIIRAAAEFEHAEIEFTGGLTGIPWDNLPDLVTAQVILVVSRLSSDLDAMHRALQPLDQYVFANRALSTILEGYELTPGEAYVVSRLDSPRKVGELITATGLSEEGTVRALYALKLAGLVTIGSGSPLRRVRLQRGRQVVDTRAFTPGQIEERERLVGFARSVRQLDHYAVLGLRREATPGEVQRAWDAVRALYDPARCAEPHLVDMEDELWAVFTRAQMAFEVLSKDAQRARYDRILAEGGAADPVAADPERQRQVRREMARANLDKADELVALGEVHLAIQALDAAAKMDPQPETLLRLARLQAKNPQWLGRAIESLQRAAELDGSRVEVWLELAELWRQRSQPEHQRKALERALVVDPTCEVALQTYRKAFGGGQLRRALSRLRD